MSFKGITINKVQGGLVRSGETSDRTILIVCGATAVAGLAHYATLELQSIEDLEALGITEATDLSAGELTHYHVDECFRISPDRSLHLMLVPKTELVSTLVAQTSFKDGIRAISGINVIGLCGLAADTTASVAVAAAQGLVDSFASEFIYIDSVLIEGLGAYVPSSLATLVDARALDCENVSIVIAQDPAQAAKNAEYIDHAAVGTALGGLSARYVHENLGSVDVENHPTGTKGNENFSLTDSKLGKWQSAALSNGTKLSAVSLLNQKLITDKGYIFVGGFNGYAGFYFSNSPTCTLATSAYAYIEYNCIWNKAARIIRNTMIPRVRSKVQADPATGYIKSTTISDWDARIRKALEPMVTAGDVADFDIYIDPKQAAVSSSPYSIKVQLVADGIVNEFTVDLGFTNKA
jgi:hypothetical protein